jgi:hypothetical protein
MMGRKYLIVHPRKLDRILKIPGLPEAFEDIFKEDGVSQSNATPLEEKFCKKKEP